MAHIREQIRTAAVSLLTGLTTTGPRVFAARDLISYPLQPTELPSVVIEVVDEQVEQAGYGGSGAHPLICLAALRLTVTAKSATGAVDTVDDACAEVQTAIVNAGRIASAAVTSYDGTDGPTVDASTEKPVVRAVMNFGLRYVMAANAPTVAL